MSLEQLKDYSVVVEVVIAFLSLVVTAAVTVLVYRGTKAIAAIEYSRAMRDAWMMFDATALGSDAMLAAADELMDPGTRGDSMESRRRRWLAFMVLNIQASTFDGHQKKLLKDEDARASYEQLLMPLVRNAEVYQLTQSRGYSPAFRKYCRDLHEKFQATNGGSAPHIPAAIGSPAPSATDPG